MPNDSLNNLFGLPVSSSVELKGDWKLTCPPSTYTWWLPMAISFSIYVVIGGYLAIRWAVTTWRTRKDPPEHVDAFPSILYSHIFGDIMPSEYMNGDQEFEFDDDNENCSRHCSLPDGASAVRMHFEDSPWEDGKFGLNSTVSTAEWTLQMGGRLIPHHGTSTMGGNSISLHTMPTLLQSQDETDCVSPVPSDGEREVASTYSRRGIHSKIEHCNMQVRIFCEKWTSVSYPMGRIMLTIFVLLCTLSWIIYIIGTIQLSYVEDEPGYIESRHGRSPLLIEGICLTTSFDVLNWADFIIHIYFFINFFLRVGAATDRAAFFFKITSIVDMLTIPSSLMAVFQGRYHLDLGFLRALNIFNFGEVFSYLGILSSNRSIQRVEIFFSMFALWMVASGMIHLIIHIGDFWKPNHGATTWNYLDCCYFLLVTMSTVGFGDYAPPTTLGKMFICVFIPVAMGIFAVFVPELFRNFSQNTVETGTYQVMAGRHVGAIFGPFFSWGYCAVSIHRHQYYCNNIRVRHVVLCGHFNNNCLHNVLKGFFHIEHTTRRHIMNMVILRLAPIDLAMKAILTKYKSWVQYYQGTPNNPQDLSRISFRSSQGALVLATPNSSQSNDEDGANIMQAIALKAQSDGIRVLVQLNHYSNKCLLNNFPRWTCLNKDMVICMDELKLGLLAYNCLAPGFSTLMLNLLNGHRMKQPTSRNKHDNWRIDYEYGVSMEIYDVHLSYEFHNLSAQELSLVTAEDFYASAPKHPMVCCTGPDESVQINIDWIKYLAGRLDKFAYEKWNILLLALCCTAADQPNVILNPAGHQTLLIDITTMKAVVIATNSTIANNLRNFCTACKAHERNENCQCPVRINSIIKAVGQSRQKRLTVNLLANLPSKHSDDEKSATSLPSGTASSASSTAASVASTHEEKNNEPEKPQDKDHEPHYTEREFTKDDFGTKLRFPLNRLSTRSVNSALSQARFSVTPAVLRPIQRNTRHPSLIPSSDGFAMLQQPCASKEIDSTGSFHWVPDIPIARAKLMPNEAARYQFRDHYLLCIVGPIAGGSLNLKSFVYPLRFYWMEIRDIVILGDTGIIRDDEWLKISNLPNIFLVHGSPCSLNDLKSVRLTFCASCTILGESMRSENDDQCLQDKNTLFCAMTIRSLLQKSAKSIHTTTEIHYEQNAHHFSSAEAHKVDFKSPIRFQESFARGIVFSNTLLYSSISSLYFSGAAFDFLRVLIFGSAVEKLESIDALHSGLQQGRSGAKNTSLGMRVCLFNMNDPPFRGLFLKPNKRPLRYKDVFSRAIMCWRILCLGLYRQDERRLRFVFTNPPRSLHVRPDDQVFCFVAADSEWLQKESDEVPNHASSFSTFSRPNNFRARSVLEIRRQTSLFLPNIRGPTSVINGSAL